jgi:ABC-type transport system involved in multi-copper enzyme maturation permease subunit
VNGVSEALLGPLAGLECRRSLERPWVLFVRWLAVVPPAVVLLGVFWAWWFFYQFVPGYSPQGVLAFGLTAVEGMLITVALVLSPALLAGTLAGEKVRSTLALLLASRVSSREIVVARLAGRLCVVGAFLLAGMPALVFLAALCGLGPAALALLIGLPLAVAFGGGGLALAASAVARRGRDALLLVYLADLLLLLAPFLGSSLPAAVQQWLDPVSPYQGIGPLLEFGATGPLLRTVGLWSLLGVAGTLTAAWRLRPSYLGDGQGRARWSVFRRRVPPVGDKPLAWKERYIAPAGSLHRVLRWLGILVVAGFLGTTLVLAGQVVWGSWLQPDPEMANGALARLTLWSESSWPLGWLIQWALGLQAAVAVASERERGTWDALLASPLEGREIVGAKIVGVLHGLRWFIAAVVLAWTLALVCGALGLVDYGKLVGNALIGGVFMVVIGTWFSLSSATATRAMTFTLLAWLGAAFGTAVIAGILALIIGLVVTFLWMLKGAVTPGGGPPFLTWMAVGYAVSRLLLYALAALLAAGYCRRNFDRLAGRSFPAPRWLPRPRSAPQGRPCLPRTGPAR